MAVSDDVESDPLPNFRPSATTKMRQYNNGRFSRSAKTHQDRIIQIVVTGFAESLRMTSSERLLFPLRGRRGQGEVAAEQNFVIAAQAVSLAL